MCFWWAHRVGSKMSKMTRLSLFIYLYNSYKNMKDTVYKPVIFRFLHILSYLITN